MRPARPLLALALAGCVSAVPAGPLIGSWGGRHVGLELDSAGGRLDYDCAAGTIYGPVVPGADGSFRAAGTHVPGTGGPERVGEVRPSYPATYSGRLAGETMTLLVEYRSAQEPVRMGPFTLRRGAEPMLLRCL